MSSFLVLSLKKYIKSFVIIDAFNPHYVSICKENLGKIPSTKALIMRGINVGTVTCNFCSRVDECSTHIFLGCQFAKITIKWIFWWCRIDGYNVSIVGELLQYATNWGQCTTKRKILTRICFGILLLIWKVKNDWIFKHYSISPMLVADNTKSLTYPWNKHKGEKWL